MLTIIFFSSAIEKSVSFYTFLHLLDTFPLKSIFIIFVSISFNSPPYKLQSNQIWASIHHNVCKYIILEIIQDQP